MQYTVKAKDIRENGMSLHLEFEPHSWYMGFAIQETGIDKNDITNYSYNAYIDNGNSGHINTVHASNLKELKQRIRNYHLKAHNGYGECIAKRRLAYLQEEITQERISYGEMAELQSLKSYIPKDKIGLLTWVDIGPEMV